MSSFSGDEPSMLPAVESSPQRMLHTLWLVDRMHLPLLVVVTSNLMDVGPFESAAARSGYRIVTVGSDALADLDPVAAFVDLETSGADDAIVGLAKRGVRVIAYGPHVDALAMVRARSLGASVAEPRSRVLRDPAKYLSPLV